MSLDCAAKSHMNDKASLKIRPKKRIAERSPVRPGKDIATEDFLILNIYSKYIRDQMTYLASLSAPLLAVGLGCPTIGLALAPCAT